MHLDSEANNRLKGLVWSRVYLHGLGRNYVKGICPFHTGQYGFELYFQFLELLGMNLYVVRNQ